MGWFNWTEKSTIRALLNVNDMIRGLRLDVVGLEKRIMAKFDEVLAEIDAATDAVAAELKALADQLAAGGLTSTEEDAVVASLRQKAARLEALGKPPANEVPEPVPTPEPPPGSDKPAEG